MTIAASAAVTNTEPATEARVRELQCRLHEPRAKLGKLQGQWNFIRRDPVPDELIAAKEAMMAKIGDEIAEVRQQIVTIEAELHQLGA